LQGFGKGADLNPLAPRQRADPQPKTNSLDDYSSDKYFPYNSPLISWKMNSFRRFNDNVAGMLRVCSG
jgi:hypothetical protein